MTAARRGLLGGSRAIGWRTGARGAKEQLAPVGIGDVAYVCALERVIARLVAVDNDLGADREGILRDSLTKQRVRTSAFNHPHFSAAVRFLHFHVDPRMWVDP